MPASYVIEPGWCWPGIDNSTDPAGYKLGIVTVRIFADGLEAHIAKVADDARLKAESAHNKKMGVILKQMGGVPHAE